MPRTDISASGTNAGEPVRVCADCRRAKTIRGVWYLVPGNAAPFVCETCFASRPPMRAFS